MSSQPSLPHITAATASRIMSQSRKQKLPGHLGIHAKLLVLEYPICHGIARVTRRVLTLPQLTLERKFAGGMFGHAEAMADSTGSVCGPKVPLPVPPAYSADAVFFLKPLSLLGSDDLLALPSAPNANPFVAGSNPALVFGKIC
jgi:hypothetical protein